MEEDSDPTDPAKEASIMRGKWIYLLLSIVFAIVALKTAHQWRSMDGPARQGELVWLVVYMTTCIICAMQLGRGLPAGASDLPIGKELQALLDRPSPQHDGSIFELILAPPTGRSARFFRVEAGVFRDGKRQKFPPRFKLQKIGDQYWVEEVFCSPDPSGPRAA